MSKEFKKGDVVNYRFKTFFGVGIITRQTDYTIWDIMVEEEFQDVRCFRENIEKTNPPRNVFDLIRKT